jgi:hypothetical protein
MKNTDSLESILADMRQKYLEVSEETPEKAEPANLADASENQRRPTSPHPSLDRLLKELQRESLQNQPPQQTSSVAPSESRLLAPELDRFVAQQKADAQAKIAQKAQHWLKELDPLSGEGIWFAELAKHYPSDLDAAIDLFAR